MLEASLWRLRLLASLIPDLLIHSWGAQLCSSSAPSDAVKSFPQSQGTENWGSTTLAHVSQSGSRTGYLINFSFNILLRNAVVHFKIKTCRMPFSIVFSQSWCFFSQFIAPWPMGQAAPPLKLFRASHLHIAGTYIGSLDPAVHIVSLGKGSQEPTRPRPQMTALR